jgi:tetratricopeptide (TPR) repeat protein
VAVLAAIAAPTLNGQSPGASEIYRGAVAIYRHTADIGRASTPIQNWSPAEFDAATRTMLASQSADDVAAAAIFHLEIGVALAGLSTRATELHFKYGQQLLDRFTSMQARLAGAAPREEQQFRATWYGVAGSAFLATRDLSRARPLLMKANGTGAKSARTQTMMGMLDEFDAAQFNPDDWTTLAQRDRILREQSIRLHRAQQQYREAARLDDTYALAHIRLGRVLHLSGQLKEAHLSLERGRAAAAEPLARYLAALFLGALQADEQDLAAARRSFEQAVAIAPGSQPAVVALAHLELMAGRPDRANALARGLAEPSLAGEPWWAFHYGGLDVGGLRSLRERVLR